MHNEKLFQELEREIGHQLKLIYPGWITANVVTSHKNGYVIEKGEVVGLNLCSLNLRYIPKTIFNFLNLRLLRLSKNEISEIPDDICNLEKLTYLNLENNKITYLPKEMFTLQLEVVCEKIENDYSYSRRYNGWDKGILISDNPIETPPIEIVQRGRNAIIEYYRSLEEGPKTPLNEGKLILVGDGGAGKTSLVKRILGREFDKFEKQTHGIRIKNWDIVAYDKKEIKVNIWDFGGQEIMHATHQFFLSKRCLYVLVLDARKDEKTEYWLKHIESFGGDSPIIIILNKIDENPGFEINRKFLKEKYEGIRGFFRISCKTCEGINNLIEKLKKEMSNIDIINTCWPQSWFNVKLALERMTINYISCKKYEEICKTEKINSIESQEILLDFLHDLGVVIHFKDLPLKDLNVINPKWVTTAVYNIINSKNLSDAKGILYVNLIGQILDEKNYPKDKHNYIVELMKKFELCYSLPTNNILIPNLLVVEEPEFHYINEDDLYFVFSYDFLPKSIIPRFIVKMNLSIKGDLRWRTGVILEDDACKATAIIKSDDEEKRISIKVYGEQKRDFFSIIRHTIKEINNSFEKIDVTELVPLPGYEEIEVEYAELIGYERAGKEEIFIGRIGTTFSVVKLLNGIKKKEERDIEHVNIINVEGDYYDKSQSKTQMEIKEMSNITTKVGNGSTIMGNMVIANKINDSFNKVDNSNLSDEIVVLLRELTSAIGEMSKSMQEKQAAQIATDFDVLVNEVTSDSPRRKWWKLSVEGIEGAAKAVGAIGKTTIEIIKKLIPLLENV